MSLDDWKSKQGASSFIGVLIQDELCPRGMLAGLRYDPSITWVPGPKRTPEQLREARLEEIRTALEDGDTMEDVVYVGEHRGDFYTHRNVYTYDDECGYYRRISRNPPEVQP